MWAGSKHRDTRGGKKRDGGEREKKEAFWEHLAMVQSSVRRIASRVGRDGGREAGREKREGETFGDCVAGVPLMSP